MKWVRAALDGLGITSQCIDQAGLWRDRGSFDPRRRRLAVGDAVVESCDLIWYRRAYPVRVGRMSLGDAEFAREEFADFLFGALHSFGAEWHAPPTALAAASFKPAQLAWAMRDGRLAVPDTLVTSVPEDALAFMGARPADFVLKPLAGPLIETEEGFDALYTSRVTPDLLDRIEDLRQAPCILQAFVPRACDVRLNVIGDTVFATRLDTAQDPAAEADCRKVYYTDMGYRVIEPPDAIAAACRAMCSDFGISFGAFDFAVDHDGRWWFLENNPWGQWAWVEEMTGQALSAAFAAFFAQRIAAVRGVTSPAYFPPE